MMWMVLLGTLSVHFVPNDLHSELDPDHSCSISTHAQRTHKERAVCSVHLLEHTPGGDSYSNTTGSATTIRAHERGRLSQRLGASTRNAPAARAPATVPGVPSDESPLTLLLGEEAGVERQARPVEAVLADARRTVVAAGNERPAASMIFAL